MSRSFELLNILRLTLIELERAEWLDDALLEVKRSLMRSIAEIKSWDNEPEKPSTQL
jgi:hypothetical protein